MITIITDDQAYPLKDVLLLCLIMKSSGKKKSNVYIYLLDLNNISSIKLTLLLISFINGQGLWEETPYSSKRVSFQKKKKKKKVSFLANFFMFPSN
jgi:hypothetical protein